MQKWGDWLFEPDSLRLVFRSGPHYYEIPLGDITDSAKMLDRIFQIRSKSWMTNEAIGDLISAFHDLFYPQGTICAQGVNRTIDPKAWLNRSITRH